MPRTPTPELSEPTTAKWMAAALVINAARELVDAVDTWGSTDVDDAAKAEETAMFDAKNRLFEALMKYEGR